MTKLAAACFAVLLCCSLPAGPVGAALNSADPTVTETALAHEEAALQAVLVQAQAAQPDPTAIVAALQIVLADPAFASLPENERHQAQFLYGAGLFDMHNYRDAQVPLQRATAMPEAEAYDWNLRLENAFMLPDYDDAARALTMIARTWPEKLVQYRDQAIYRIMSQVLGGRASADLPFDLLTALYAAKWQPSDPFERADWWLLELARLRLAHGDLHGAEAVAGGIRDYAVLVEMHADRRFDSIVQADPPRYNVAKVLAEELTAIQAEAAAAPGKLAGVNAVATELLNLNRASEALTLVDGALARIAAKRDAYSDTDDKINWTQDLRARLLFALGRSDEALAALAAGAALSEHGAVNVSQAINLADEYVAYDRPHDALVAVAALDTPDLSTYGRMALDDARACALYQLGNTAQVRVVLAYMKAHIGDGLQPYIHAMLCTGNLNAVATEVIAQLADPARRLGALYVMQDYLPQPHASRREQSEHAAWNSVRRRPDVAAALAAVGRIESYPMLPPNY